MESVLLISRPKAGKVRGTTEVYSSCNKFLTLGIVQDLSHIRV